MPTAYKVVSADYQSRLTCTHGTVLRYGLGEQVGPAPEPGLFAYHKLVHAVARWARRPGFEERPRIIVLEYGEADVMGSQTHSRNLRLRHARVTGEVSSDEAVAVLEQTDARWAAWARGMLERQPEGTV